jgi:hypothetical protein
MTRSSIARSVLGAALAARAAAAPPAFMQEPAPLLPATTDNTYLNEIAAGTGGRLAAAGRRWTVMNGGAHKHFVVLEKACAAGAWTETPTPFLGSDPRTYQELRGIAFLPGHPDGDFVAVGEWQPDPFSAVPSVGAVIRYHRAAQAWDVRDITVPGHELVHINDVAADPAGPDRFLIAGTTATDADPVTGDADYEPLLAEYRADTDTLTHLDVPTLSAAHDEVLFSVEPRPGGGFIASGSSFFGILESNSLFLTIGADNAVGLLAGPANVPQPDYTYIYDAAVYPDGRILAVGDYYDVLDQALPIYCLAVIFDPATAQWTVLAPQNPGPLLPNGTRTNQLLGTVIAADGTAWAVGRQIVYRAEVPGYFYEAIAQSHDGAAWVLAPTPASFGIHPAIEPVATGFGPQLWDVAVHPGGSVFAAGWFQTKTTLIPSFYNTALVVAAAGPEPAPDCNGNGVPDDCDINGGGLADCDGDGVPDECEGPCAAPSVLASFTAATVLPGAGTVENEDVARYDTATGTWTMHFDGSDVGLAAFDVDALAILPDGRVLVSLTAPGTVGGVSADDSDVLSFTPAALGAATSGSWALYFDGSDVGLTSNAEDIDGLAVLPGGDLVVSVIGSPTVNGLTGLQDEDLIRFTPSSLGPATAGTWSLYFDGSDVGLASNNGEDVDAVSVGASGLVSLSTLGAFSVPGLAGSAADVFTFSPATLGGSTSGSFAAFLAGAAAGIPAGANVDALETTGP